MDLAFSTRELRKLCEKQEYARQKLGSQVYKALKERLADLVAAKSPNDLLVGNPRARTYQDYEHMAVDLCDGYQIRFLANHLDNPRTQSGFIQWSRVNRIIIVEVERFDD